MHQPCLPPSEPAASWAVEVEGGIGQDESAEIDAVGSSAWRQPAPASGRHRSCRSCRSPRRGEEGARCRRCRAAGPPSWDPAPTARAGCGRGRAPPSAARSRRRRAGTQPSPPAPPSTRRKRVLFRHLRLHRLPDIEAVHRERVAVIRSDRQRARQQAQEGTKRAPRRARGDAQRAAREARPQRQARIEGAPRDILPAMVLRARKGRASSASATGRRRPGPGGRRRRLAQVAAAASNPTARSEAPAPIIRTHRSRNPAPRMTAAATTPTALAPASGPVNGAVPAQAVADGAGAGCASAAPCLPRNQVT
jgi:hypothetical protein